MKVSEFPKPLTVILCSALGGATGAGVLLFRARSTPESQQFVETHQFLVWLFLIGLTMAVAFASVILVVKPLRELSRHFTQNGVEILSSVLAVVLLAVVPLRFSLPERFYVLAYHRVKMVILLILGLSAAIPALIGIWLVNSALRTGFEEIQPDHRPIEIFLRLRGHLQRFFAILGALISLLTLSTGALRNALISSGLAEKSQFPAELVLVYGAFFTVLVGLSYIPTYTLLTAVGRRICEVFFPLSALKPESLGKWHSGRKSLEELLQIKVGVAQSLQASMVVFAPLVSGIISVLLGD